MKTTVDIDDELLIAAKKRAAELRRPLRRLIEDGLREQLRRPTAKVEANELRWLTVDGGLPEDSGDLSDRAAMTEWIRQERR
jgi:hypothetical protein